MKLLLLILCLSLGACGTTVKSRNGVTLLSHSSDSTRLAYTYSGGGERITLDIEGHQPSKTIRAGGSVVGTLGSAVMGSIMAMKTGGVVR